MGEPEPNKLPILTALTKKLIPQQAADITVRWARRTLLAIVIASFLSALCEIWIMINEHTTQTELVAALDSLSGWNETLSSNTTDAINNADSNLRVGLTYHAVFLASIVFWLGVTWDALLNQNIMQVISINAYNFGLLVYSATQIVQTRKDTALLGPVLPENITDDTNTGGFLAAQIVLPVIIGVFIPIFAYLTYRLRLEFGWRQYRISGGDIKMRSIFFAYDVLLLLLKFSLFFVAGFTVLDLVLTSVSVNGTILIPIFGVLVALILTGAGYYGIRREISSYMTIYIIGCLLVIGYLIQRVDKAFKDSASNTATSISDFSRVQIPFVLYAVIGGCLLLGSVIYGTICWRNFGKGLKNVLDQELKTKVEGYVPEVIDLEN
ncbi:hypothetical protein HK100_005717 [Physocladia obscura]|uniref:Uncharacterized protein n=1 Tax=Physocladia obscura TaxID=109957 RepID=A0AAD5T5N3_9FUNG|nr:hypothetical protein HK100_005717 [Physocladia obscura]